MEELIMDSISFIGKEKADKLCSIGENMSFLPPLSAMPF